VAEIEWSDSPESLLAVLKGIEVKLGRKPAPRRAPRVADLDLIGVGREVRDLPHCQVPHSGASVRSFVLDPLKHLEGSLQLPTWKAPALSLARALPKANPLWMGILNLTPDSFSDGGSLFSRSSANQPFGEASFANQPFGEASFANQIERFERAGVQILDLGGESTRPGAAPVSEAEEWARLEEPLWFLRERYRGRCLRPWISVDTRRAKIAARALELGATVINDVSGAADPGMRSVLQSSECQYVLMHSLSVPADPGLHLPEGQDPVAVLRVWAERRLEEFTRAGISLDRLIFDPGFGFGKTPAQSLEISRRIRELLALPVRILAGHSRKSFLRAFGERAPRERDGQTLGLSFRFAREGVELIRVHAADLHAEAWDMWREMEA
jgi:dihydropteroate synthase